MREFDGVQRRRWIGAHQVIVDLMDHLKWKKHEAVQLNFRLVGGV